MPYFRQSSRKSRGLFGKTNRHLLIAELPAFSGKNLNLNYNPEDFLKGVVERTEAIYGWRRQEKKG